MNSDSDLLLTLREVSELVAHSHNLAETLENICRLIQSRFSTDVCSVYLLDPSTKELVLRATVGLRTESIGKVHMPLSEGLTGLVAERKTPVCVDDAPKHPRFRYFPESGEEAFRSFLGVPLIQGGIVEGVLVVQNREARPASANEIRLLVGVAAQIAILVTNARLTQVLSNTVERGLQVVERDRPTAVRQFRGISAGSGKGRVGRRIRSPSARIPDCER